MNFSLKITIILAALLIIYIVIRAVGKHNLHPSYAVLWLVIGSFLFSIPLLENFYALVARKVFGLHGGDHLVYITLITFLLVYCFYLTTRICQMADRVSKLISFTAVLGSELAELKDKDKTKQNG